MDIENILHKLLTREPPSSVSTSCFQKLKHNKDLVPTFQKKLKFFADIYGGCQSGCYDIQGITDCGVDVLFQYNMDLDSKIHRVGIQVKSYDDIKQKEWVNKLKAQLFDQRKIWDLDRMYIAFCTDAAKHKDKVRIASAEILKRSDGEIDIITPEAAKFFYDLEYTDIFLFVSSLLRSNDPLYKKTVKAVQNLNKNELRILIDIIVEQFVYRKDYSQKDIFGVISDDDCMTIDDLSENFYDLVSKGFIDENDSEGIEYRYNENWTLTNFVVEIVNFHDWGYERQELKKFIFDILNQDT
jgi:hypothetical protein